MAGETGAQPSVPDCLFLFTVSFPPKQAAGDERTLQSAKSAADRDGKAR